MNITELIDSYEAEKIAVRSKIETIIAAAQRRGSRALSEAEDTRAEALYAEINKLDGKIANARKVQAEEAEYDRLNQIVIPNPALPTRRTAGNYDTAVRVTGEAHTYARELDPELNGEQFITDVLQGYRGDVLANERLSRHMHEHEVDHKGMQTRAAGDFVTSAGPGLVVPAYLVDAFQALPSNGRPYANIMAKRPLPNEGMTVELSVGNTATQVINQATELGAIGIQSYDANPLSLTVHTAAGYQLISRQAIDRGRVENVILNDLMAQMDVVIDDTVLNEATYGLFAKSVRNENDDATPTCAEMYPLLLGMASKSQALLKNAGSPNFILMAPRRFYWFMAEVTDTFPFIGQPGIGTMQSGMANGNGYGKGMQGLFPAGLDVVVDYNVNQIILDGAATGGTEDCITVGDRNKSLLLEQPEVLIRAEQPSASVLGVQLVVYKYYAYTHALIGSGAFQRMDGIATAAPVGF